MVDNDIYVKNTSGQSPGQLHWEQDHLPSPASCIPHSEKPLGALAAVACPTRTLEFPCPMSSWHNFSGRMDHLPRISILSWGFLEKGNAWTWCVSILKHGSKFKATKKNISVFIHMMFQKTSWINLTTITYFLDYISHHESIIN